MIGLYVFLPFDSLRLRACRECCIPGAGGVLFEASPSQVHQWFPGAGLGIVCFLL